MKYVCYGDGNFHFCICYIYVGGQLHYFATPLIPRRQVSSMDPTVRNGPVKQVLQGAWRNLRE